MPTVMPNRMPVIVASAEIKASPPGVEVMRERRAGTGIVV
jgi:hypothetical protein